MLTNYLLVYFGPRIEAERVVIGDFKGDDSQIVDESERERLVMLWGTKAQLNIEWQQIYFFVIDEVLESNG